MSTSYAHNTHSRLFGEARNHNLRSGGGVGQAREVVRDRVSLNGHSTASLSQHQDVRGGFGGSGIPPGGVGGAGSSVGKPPANAGALIGAGRYDGRAVLFPTIDRDGADHRPPPLARRRGPGSGTPPAYPPPSHAHMPSAPPIPTHLSFGNNHGSHGSSAGHSSAGSRSVPPGASHRRYGDPPGSGGSTGSTMSRGGRPPTPSGGIGGSSRRDDPGPPPTLGRASTNPLDGRDSQPQASSRSRSAAAGPGPSAVSDASATCDKCDGKHSTDRCPHFRNDRERHKDAWVNYGRKGNPHTMGGSGGTHFLRSARVVRQPGDGSCLFHSLNHGLQQGGSAQSLRRELAGFLQQSPKMEIAGDTIEEWIRWDSSSTVADYARRMAMSGWGGGIEMAACSLLKNVNVHVYENARGAGNEFKRISCFDCPNASKTIHVIYQGGVHYDALVPLAA